MLEIIDTVSSLLKNDFGYTVKKNKLRLPWITGEVAMAADWLTQSCGIYLQKIHVLSEMNKYIVCSVDLAKKELQYQPKIELEEGMRRSIHWCQKAGYNI